MVPDKIRNKFAYWWDEGYISWGGIGVAVACALLGILYYHFHVIDHVALVLLSGLTLVAADVVGYLTNKRHGRALNATICLAFIIFDLLLL